MTPLSKLTEYVCDPYFGLTETEAKLLRWSMQCIRYRPDVVPDDLPTDMAAGVLVTRDGLLAMQRDFGEDPGDLNAPADRQFEYNDLSEKLLAMNPAKAARLYFFMVGYLAVWEEDET